MSMFIRQIFISPGQNFVGPDDQPGSFPLIEKKQVECIAGKGLIGDRYFNHRKDYKGQVTFFSAEVFEQLCAKFGINDKPAGVFRRNVIVSDVAKPATGGQLRAGAGKSNALQLHGGRVSGPFSRLNFQAWDWLPCRRRTILPLPNVNYCLAGGGDAVPSSTLQSTTEQVLADPSVLIVTQTSHLITPSYAT